MSDQILTQEEIDALLSAMDSGEVDLEEEAKSEAEVVTYNLTSQNIMLRDQFYALEEVYDKFATLFEAHISSVLQRSMEVEFVSTEMVKYQECISAFSSPTRKNDKPRTTYTIPIITFFKFGSGFFIMKN